MKNGNMPAMPMGKGANGSYWQASDLGDGFSEQCRPAFGLTKREMLAMHAPSDVPEWFKIEFLKSMPEHEAQDYMGDNRLAEITGIVLNRQGEKAAYFAWKVYHADALLKELEK